MQVKAHYREGRSSPWEARWWIDGKMKTRFFATERERDRFIREFSKELQKHGTDVFSMEKSRIRRWIEAERLLPNADPVQIYNDWIRDHHDSIYRPTMYEGVAKYLEHLALAGRTHDYIRHAQKCLNRFNAEHGERLVCEITADHIKAYLSQLPFRQITKRHERSYLTSAFKWFLLQDWVTRNPVSRVPVPMVQREEPGILTVAETEALFRANEDIDPEICGLLALGAFAGLRSSAIERMRFDQIDFTNRGILMTSDMAKNKRRHYIEGLPENLWAWLKRTPEPAFQLDAPPNRNTPDESLRTRRITCHQGNRAEEQYRPQSTTEELPAPQLRQLPRRAPPRPRQNRPNRQPPQPRHPLAALPGRGELGGRGKVFRYLA